MKTLNLEDGTLKELLREWAELAEEKGNGLGIADNSLFIVAQKFIDYGGVDSGQNIFRADCLPLFLLFVAEAVE